MTYKPSKERLREFNLVKYMGKMPTPELIMECMKKSGLSRRSFEITYGIPLKTIEKYIDGQRPFPVVHWHIFYEFDNLEKFYSNFIIKERRKKKEVVKKEEPVISESNKLLIDAFKERLNKR